MLRDHLLGRLTEEEREKIESRYFEDDEFFDQLHIAEDQLIDDYLEGRLQESVLKDFEIKYLRGKDRELQRLIQECLIAESAKSSHHASFPAGAASGSENSQASTKVIPFPAFLTRKIAIVGWQAAAAVLLLAVPVGWMTYRTLHLADQPQIGQTTPLPQNNQEFDRLKQELETQRGQTKDLQDQLASEHQQRTQLETQLAQAREKSNPLPSSESGPGTFASFMLLPTLTRGTDDVPPLTLAPAVQRVRFQLVLVGNPSSRLFDVSLQTVEGKKLWGKPKVKAIQKGVKLSVAVELRAEDLSPNDYVLSLDSHTEEGKAIEHFEYSFTVLAPSNSKNEPGK